MDKNSTHIPTPISPKRSPTAPMAQQRAENDAGSTPQGLLRLVGCHDPAKRKLPGKPAGNRPLLGKSLIE
ncbi:hypothetical protein HL667_05735 [Bradyrhizobium sp. 83012]|uniref:Uncharacterized protein n=1 Tax=Bradyrhizobium aeschynomenes TaxID=2734909 RepID=A0ABX2CB85_9BRAD|nr:hypothetical protein [Bradyrhizobium aeschynomenes]NPU14668.1 hypothetical protein [Bradyrhizobium aeschynomenes]NPU64494.1 hypothetical protein [Bradyrhizobium aeschynomenes]NPV21555.1 hypothetical protein [Bradyrhizobium aeschynomenes]